MLVSPEMGTAMKSKLSAALAAFSIVAITALAGVSVLSQ
jgi:hypothetical protein